MTSYRPVAARNRFCGGSAWTLVVIALFVGDRSALAQEADPSPTPAASPDAVPSPIPTSSPVAEPSPVPTPAVAVPTPAAERDAKADADDWDTAGPVNRTPRVSGVMMGSFRSTWFPEHELPDGTRVEDFKTFQVEHAHLKFSGDSSELLSWEVMPCVTHQNEFSVVTAHFVYARNPLLQVTFGRFLLPFGQFNLRSLPGSYSTVSRPLLYSSHEDRPIQIDTRLPRNFLFTPRDDTGVGVSGSKWFLKGDLVQVSYNVYLTNGLRAVSDQMGRFWDDNNSGKQMGGRLGVSFNGDPVTLSAAGSFLSNPYEETYDQRAWAADAVASYQYATARRITLRAEYVDMTREIVPTTTLLQGDEGIRGAYLTAEANITGAWALYYQWDTLTARSPAAQLNEGFQDQEVTVNRHVAGVSVILEEYLQVRAEYGLWLQPLGLPDAHRIAVQTVVTF